MKNKKHINRVDDEIICACLNVTKSAVVNCLRENDNSIEHMMSALKVGSRCASCLLDVEMIINEEFKNQKGPKLNHAKHYPDDRGRFFSLSRGKPMFETGFFVQNAKVQTTISFANFGHLFEECEYVVPFDYTVHAFRNNGLSLLKKSGRIAKNSRVNIRLSDFTGEDVDGGFFLSLRPTKKGVIGSIRPQFMLAGHGFSATVHTQPNFAACKLRTVLKIPQKRFNSSISVFNVTRHESLVGLELKTKTGQSLEIMKSKLPALGSEVFDLDEIFTKFRPNEPHTITVSSSQVTRKHVINHLKDERLSIDHFPNRK